MLADFLVHVDFTYGVRISCEHHNIRLKDINWQPTNKIGWFPNSQDRKELTKGYVRASLWPESEEESRL